MESSNSLAPLGLSVGSLSAYIPDVSRLVGTTPTSETPLVPNEVYRVTIKGDVPDYLYREVNDRSMTYIRSGDEYVYNDDKGEDKTLPAYVLKKVDDEDTFEYILPKQAVTLTPLTGGRKSRRKTLRRKK